MQFEDQEGHLVETLDKEPVYILCHPYSNDPVQNFQRCVLIVHYLRSKLQLKIFSPILHTHQYDFTLKDQQREYGEDYYQWDLDIYAAFPANSIFLFSKDYKESQGCKLEMQWVKNNQRFILFINERM